MAQIKAMPLQPSVVQSPANAPTLHLAGDQTISGKTGQPAASKSLRLHRLLLVTVLLGALPLVCKFLSGLNDRPQYEFYPLLLIATLWLAWDRWPEGTARRDANQSIPGRGYDPWFASIAFGALGLAVLAVGAGLYVRWLAWPAMLLLLASVTLRLGGWALARTLAPCFLLLLTILPAPGHYDQLTLTKLQHLAVVGSSRLLDLLNVPNLISGTTIEIPRHRLLIEQACSGINSVVSISAFTLLYASVQRRGPLRVVLLLMTAVAFILLINLIRIALGAVLLAKWEINLLEPSVHSTVSFAMFTIGLGLTLSADQLLELAGDAFWSKTQNEPNSTFTVHEHVGATSAMASEKRAAEARQATERSAKNGRNEPNVELAEFISPQNQTSAASAPVLQDRAVSESRPSLFHNPALWPWVILAGLSLTIGGWTYVRVRDCWPASRLSGGMLFEPPTQVGQWQLVDGAGGATQRIESVARFQHRWVYRDGDALAEVSFAYPFNALYHDAAECYLYTGWQVEGRSFSHDGAGVLNTVSIIKPGESRGLLVFGAFDEAGQPDLPPPREADLGFVRQSLAFSREVALHRPSCEVQTLRVDSRNVTPSGELALKQLFTAVHHELRSQVIRQVMQP